jgi:hypothetical protein
MVEIQARAVPEWSEVAVVEARLCGMQPEIERFEIATPVGCGLHPQMVGVSEFNPAVVHFYE